MLSGDTWQAERAKMPRGLDAAVQINALWHRCLELEHILPASCPTDDDVAAIIEKHFQEEDSHE